MTDLASIIRDEILRHENTITFARFMELALYHPEFGYYEKPQGQGNVGRAGDFYTSVSTGKLFGELLAFQFAEWLEPLRAKNSSSGKLSLVEAGAHDGKLAGDILAWLQGHRPKLFTELEYVILEPSSRRHSWQAENLKSFASSVRWVTSPQSLHAEPITGIIFSNELLDAFPIHRFGWDAVGKRWFEWGVGCEGNHFVWTKNFNPPPSLRHAELESVLPDGYTVETSPAAEAWWQAAAGALKFGKLLAIDYGLTADEVFSPARTNGTVRSYSRHRVGSNVLDDPGEQDLTAHVNFSAIQKAGEDVGLSTDTFTTQTRFLTQILARTQSDPSFGKWDAARARQFQTLTHPEHLGRSFRVLAQGC